MGESVMGHLLGKEAGVKEAVEGMGRAMENVPQGTQHNQQPA